MKKTPTMTTPSGLLSFFRILFSDIKELNIFSYFLQISLAFISTKCKALYNMKPLNIDSCFHEDHNDEKLCTAEVKMVIYKLGMPCDLNVYMLGAEELSALFEEAEPSLEEVKEAFDAFDENKDGFIDATELQTVLCSLGLQEVSEVEACRRMINAFDENGDGLIDFSEFVKLVEKCLC